MTLQSKEIPIESIEIDKDFLKKIGKIVEKEINTRQEKSKALIEERIEEERKAINQGKFDKASKEDLLELRKRRIERALKPKYECKYELRTEDGAWAFTSLEELLSLDTFPKKIKGITIRISHDDTSFVDILIELHNPVYGTPKFTISSENGPKLLAIAQELKELFADYKTKHFWIYRPPFSYWPVIVFLFGITSLVSFVTIAKLAHLALPWIPWPIRGNHVPFAAGIGLFWFMIISAILSKTFEFLYPYFCFELSQRENSKKIIKGIFWAVVGGLVISAIYDLIRLIF